MKKENLPILILIASFVLIILNIFTSGEFDFGFWLRIIANIFLILGMIKLIKNNKAKK